MQRQTVSKWQRALRPTMASVAPGFLNGLSEAETAALAMRNEGAAAGAPQSVWFIVPVVGRKLIEDWQAVEARLRAAVDSLQRQTDGRWRALVCCEDVPDLPWSDKLRHLPFVKHGDGFDKWDKLRALVAEVHKDPQAQGYLMPLDADDLVHPDLVARLLTEAAPNGYLMQSGFMFDAGAQKLAIARPRSLMRPRQKAFWKLCGSCAAFPLDTASPASLPFLQGVVSYEHRMFEYLARLASRPLRPVPEPLVTYMTNHGNNFSRLRGRGGFKARLIARYAVTDPAMLARFHGDFPGALAQTVTG